MTLTNKNTCREKLKCLYYKTRTLRMNSHLCKVDVASIKRFQFKEPGPFCSCTD